MIATMAMMIMIIIAAISTMYVQGTSLEPVPAGVGDGLLVGVGEAVGCAVGEGDGLGEEVGAGVGEGVGDGDAVGVGDGLGVGVGAGAVMFTCVMLFPPEPIISKPSGPTITSLGAGSELLGKFVPLTW